MLIDGDRSSETTNGSASYTVATDANGVAQFSVSGSEPGAIDVAVSYESQPIDKATIQVTAAAKVATKAPGRATIAKLSALVGRLRPRGARTVVQRRLGDHVVPVLDLPAVRSGPRSRSGRRRSS